jgi:hypothetical protein
MRRPVCAAAGLLALASCTTTGSEPSPDYHYYICQVEAADAAGRTSIQVDLELDGTRRQSLAEWTSPPNQPGARLSIAWLGQNLPSPTDDLRVTISYPRRWHAGRRLRLELFRTADGRSGDGVLSDTTYYRGGTPLAITRWRSELQQFAAGESGFLVGVAEQGRGLLAQDRIELAQLDVAAPTFARARPRLEAMIADYRNACRRTEEVVILT